MPVGASTGFRQQLWIPAVPGGHGCCLFKNTEEMNDNMNETQKQLLEKLGLPYAPICIRYSYVKPEGVDHVDETLSFCQFVRKAQDGGKAFYTTVEDDNCFGKVALGMAPKPPLAASGAAGVVYGVYRTEAPNARLHNTYPTLVPGSVRYVTFCPAEKCGFDPDLLICVAEPKQADILLRASSYVSGDLWEQKISCVMSCAWMYAYPYVSGKLNYCITGLHHGMKRRHVYPEGLFILSIPYAKLPELFIGLEEMPWVLPAVSEDPEVQAKLKREMDVLRQAEENSMFVE